MSHAFAQDVAIFPRLKLQEAHLSQLCFFKWATIALSIKWNPRRARWVHVAFSLIYFKIAAFLCFEISFKPLFFLKSKILMKFQLAWSLFEAGELNIFKHSRAKFSLTKKKYFNLLSERVALLERRSFPFGRRSPSVWLQEAQGCLEQCSFWLEECPNCRENGINIARNSYTPKGSSHCRGDRLRRKFELFTRGHEFGTELSYGSTNNEVANKTRNIHCKQLNKPL